MSVTLKHRIGAPNNFPLTIRELEDGKAYESEYGQIFIGCSYGEIYAFEVTGCNIVTDNFQTRFREVNVTITVKN